MNSMRRVVMLLVLLALAGCGTWQGAAQHDEPATVEEMRGDGTEAGKALAYYSRVRRMAAPELTREQDATRRALSRSRTDGNRMRHALTLVAAGPAAGDDVRALELLEPVARNDGSALQGLALLMTALLQEQRRIDGQVQGLQQKLDALLSLERNMTIRDSTGARKR